MTGAWALATGHRIVKEIYEYGANNPDWLDNLRKMSYDEAMESLLTRKGIGKKVANCICLLVYIMWMRFR